MQSQSILSTDAQAMARVALETALKAALQSLAAESPRRSRKATRLLGRLATACENVYPLRHGVVQTPRALDDQRRLILESVDLLGEVLFDILNRRPI